MFNKICLILAAACSFARAGESIPEAMTIPQMVGQSAVIVVALKAKVFTRNKSVPPANKNGRKHDYIAMRYQVLETIKGTPKLGPGGVVEVTGADESTIEYLQTEGLSKSFYSDEYREGYTIAESHDTLILLLHAANERGEHPLVANMSVLAPSSKAEVSALAKRP